MPPVVDNAGCNLLNCILLSIDGAAEFHSFTYLFYWLLLHSVALGEAECTLEIPPLMANMQQWVTMWMFETVC